jgi:hypothetical protein
MATMVRRSRLILMLCVHCLSYYSWGSEIVCVGTFLVYYADYRWMWSPEWTRNISGIMNDKWRPSNSPTGRSLCHFVHHKPYVDCPGSKPRPPFWEVCNKPHELWYGVSYSLTGSSWLHICLFRSVINCMQSLRFDPSFPVTLIN